MRLIDADAYKDCRIVLHKEDDGIAVKDIKTVDAVPIVRCKDCTHWTCCDEYEGEHFGDCEINQVGDKALFVRMFSEDHFCANGKRRVSE